MNASKKEASKIKYACMCQFIHLRFSKIICEPYR
jgi:hypothetical protein